MKKYLLHIKALSMLLVMLILFSSCDFGNNGGQVTGTTAVDNTTAEEIIPIKFIEKGIETEYIFIRPDNVSTDMQNVYTTLYSDMKTFYELPSFKIKTDWYKEGSTDVISQYEILVGNTNRPETQSVLAKLGINDYMITVIGEKLVICGGSDDATKNAILYFKEAYLTSESLLLSENDTYCNSEAPLLLSTYPEERYYFEKNQTPEITLNYNCAPGVDMAKTTVIIGDTDYTAQTQITKDSLVFSGQTLPFGNHTMKLNLVNTSGANLYYEYPFTVGDGTNMNLYCGEIHGHTEQSDGQGTVEEAYAYARDVAKLDYFSITDHSDSFSDAIYENIHKVVAGNFNEPGKFAALYGYEQTYNNSSGFFGHLNVINSPEKTSKTLKLDPFYNKMSGIPQAIGMFDHPGYTWGNFLEYDLYCAQYDTFMNLMEVKGSGYDTEYALSLTKGWHISPVHNEDNHSKQWGTANEAVGYALAGSLTQQNIVEAFQKNRTYTTTDRSLKIFYSINGEWMGARLNNPSTLNVKVELSTDKPAGLGIIYLMGEDNIVVATKNVGAAKSYTWDIELPALHDYYYVKVSNSSAWAVTAPIWIENRNLINITDTDMGLLSGKDGTADQFGAATIQNSSTSDMSGVVVKFYASTYSGFDMTRVNPFSTVNVGEIKAGQSVDVSAALTYSLSNNRVTVVVEGNIGGNKYFDTKYMQLSELYITEVLPMGSYDFIELYNNSDKELALDNFSIRYYHKAGAKAADLAGKTWTLSGKIAPHSTMVVWITNSTNTVADFNAYYKTSLVEGQNIIKIKTTILIPESNAVQIEILNNKTVVDRIWYNWGNRTMPIYSGKSNTYEYQDSYTLTNKQTDYKAIPTPGTVNSSQVPLLMTVNQWLVDFKVSQ